MNSKKQNLTENQLNFFKTRLELLFLNKIKITDEKIFYILTIFNFEIDKCLLYLNHHKKSWEAFFSLFEP